jgi:hypothetical protein
MAAVRQRIREDNARSKAAGKPEMPEATVLKMAEDVLPRLRVAEWLDRAEAAQRQLAHLDLRDLRSVVAASEDPLVVRDESTRALAAELKASLAVKQEEELNLWLGDVEAAVDVGRVVRALRLSAMPPKAGVPFPAVIGSKLGAATVAALTADDPSDRWIAVLEAAAFSPIRTLVTPAAPPAQPSSELVATVTRLGPLLPQVAALFAIEVPDKAPTPKPLRPTLRKKEPARKPPAAAAAAKSARSSAKPEAAPDAEPATLQVVADTEPVESPQADVEPVESPAVADVEPVESAAVADVEPVESAAVADVEPVESSPVADVEPVESSPVADVEPADPQPVAATEPSDHAVDSE